MLISFYTLLIFVLLHMINCSGFNFEFNGELLLTASLLEQNGTARLLLIVFSLCLTFTVLVVVTSEICACTVRRPAATIAQPTSCSPTFIFNPIPFLSLHICVAMVFLKQIIIRFLFDVTVPPWLVICGLLSAIFATNGKAKRHVALRIQQKVATMTVERNNNVVHPRISVALVPLREQSRDQDGGVPVHTC